VPFNHDFVYLAIADLLKSTQLRQGCDFSVANPGGVRKYNLLGPTPPPNRTISNRLSKPA